MEQVRGRLAHMRRATTGPEVVQALARVRDALPLYRTVLILPYDEAAATHFGRLRHILPHHPGTQAPCIVAIALRHGATLVTRNQRDFQGRVAARQLVRASALRLS